jgi:hypothetical protein
MSRKYTKNNKNNKKGGEYTSISKTNENSEIKSRPKLNSYKEGLNSEQLIFVRKLEKYYSQNLGHSVEIENDKIMLTLLHMKTQIDVKEGIVDNEINEDNYHKLFDTPKEKQESIQMTKPKHEQTTNIHTIQESRGQDGNKNTRIFYPNGKVYEVKDSFLSRNLPSIMTRKRIAGSSSTKKNKKKVPKKSKTQKKKFSKI